MDRCTRYSGEAYVKKDETCKFRILSGERQCESCGQIKPHSTVTRIGNALCSQTNALNGEEIRFLREMLRFDRRTFADILDISESYLDRLEHGEEKPSNLVDKLIRAAFRLAQHGSVQRKERHTVQELSPNVRL